MRHFSHASLLLAITITSALTASAAAEVVYEQPPKPGGPFYLSCRWGEDGSDYDEYVWDSFILTATRSITEVHWRGGYPVVGAPLIAFEVAIYKSIAAGSQPDLGFGPLVEYFFEGDAGETPAGTVAGVAVYDYGVTLPVPFDATGGTKYWVEILAWQSGFPHWSLQAGTGGNGSHFRFSEGSAMYFLTTGDTTFSLVATPLPCPTDLDGSGAVDGGDLGVLLAGWGQPGLTDLNGDNATDGGDLGVLLANWGDC